MSDLLQGRRPRAAVILGSGLGAVADALEDPLEIPYAEIPGLPQPKVKGHTATLVAGRRGDTEVICFKGRRHVYDGATAQDLWALPRFAHAVGAEILVVTNAAGSLNPANTPGSIVAISDHINLQGVNPLVGEPDFISLRDAYDPALRRLLATAAAELAIPLSEGVYLAVSGPSFETPAEIRAFRTLGADLVGMSTVPEVIVARRLGLRVAALSAVTNLAEGLSDVELSHAQTLDAADTAAQSLVPLLATFLERV